LVTTAPSPHDRVRVAGFIAAIGGVIFVWWNGHIDPASIDLGATIDLLVIAVIGGLYRLEGAWVGALFFVIINNYSQRIGSSARASHLDWRDLSSDRARLAWRLVVSGARPQTLLRAPPWPPDGTRSGSASRAQCLKGGSHERRPQETKLVAGSRFDDEPHEGQRGQGMRKGCECGS